MEKNNQANGSYQSWYHSYLRTLKNYIWKILSINENTIIWEVAISCTQREATEKRKTKRGCGCDRGELLAGIQFVSWNQHYNSFSPLQAAQTYRNLLFIIIIFPFILLSFLSYHPIQSTRYVRENQRRLTGLHNLFLISPEAEFRVTTLNSTSFFYFFS